LHRRAGADLLQVADDDAVALRQALGYHHQVAVGGAGGHQALLDLVAGADDIDVLAELARADGDLRDQQRVGLLKADLLLGKDSEPSVSGSVTFLDNVVDRSTGTITARAAIANPQHTLLPGQYVRVRLHIADRPDTLLVPQAALISTQLGKSVYVVGAGNKVEVRLLTLGPTVGPLVVVEKGISEGESVITGNLQKTGPGATVQPMAKPGQPGS